ncbi:MAG: ABC-F family ATP-binding cassette domain-containing protein [Clostridia bacterium]|nr:ABC-F family ATP-binding cassette domain-containing protein [Clostridia bacterium]
MVMVSANNLKMEFGNIEIFGNVTFDIYDNDKIGLIGVNGAGKTTLFKVLTKEYEYTDGNLVIGKNTVIGYMQQHACHNSQKTVYNELLTVFEHLIQLENKIERIIEKIENKAENLDKLIDEQLKLQEEYQDKGGLTYKSRAKATLIGLGFSEDDFDKPVSILSGGQKSKLSLGKLLLSGANLLLLDEPTNHLDIKSVEWLEGWISEFDGSIMVISHDRYFLDKVTNKTMEMERGKTVLTKGNYSRFMELKAERQMNAERHYEQTMKEVHRIEGIIAQQKTFSQERNYITIAHKQKSIDRLLDGLEEPEKELESLRFNFSANYVSGNDVVTAKGLSKSFDGKKLFSDIDFLIKRNERVFLLGDNGCGKTTLLKILLGEYRPDGGECEFGANVDIGYFDQTLAKLNESKTVLDEVWDSYLHMTESSVRTALGSFLFKGDDVFKKVGDLSGGEKARVAMLKLMLKGANLLLLDEPTNHLDIKSREALENALLNYDGTMLIVSHDRYLINKLATRIFRMTDNGIKVYNGNYDYYLEHFVESQTVREEKITPKINDYKLRKQRESDIRKLKGAILRCEARISEYDEKITAKEKELENDENMANYEIITKITDELTLLHEEQDALMTEWEELQLKLEDAENEE